MLNFLKTDAFLISILILNIFLFMMVIISFVRIRNINKKHKEFIRKLGNGRDITEDLNKYMDRVIDLEESLSQTNIYCRQLKKRIEKCVQKVGVVRFSAYKNSGNDLSFAVALLDEKNNGVVLNGLYSREMSNVYAKPIENGKSRYAMTPEESRALIIAMNEEKE